ncbi:hypothetical protein GBF38_004835 [Nibea albiflora]|uniref:Uncharacterized protein n=1 Tax=Nibea albiflora TaxID=240163 RepID=A0ACB7EG88_NIBAL|nr:hypothetical protein GBF38_004835 [Nibea albiflora]
MQRAPLRTEDCLEPNMNATWVMWDCDRNRLINRNTSMLLSVDGGRLILTHDNKQSKWRSLNEGDICQEKLRSRRSSEPDEFDAAEEQTGKLAMTEEQREYLRWYYRTEDPSMWRFVLLGLAFICLLAGFMLLGMGTMANKNRKEISKYRAAAVAQKHEGAELLVISPHRDDSKPSPSNGEVSELKAGNIVVTWKDGNTSCLYSDPGAEKEKQEGVSAAEPEADEAVKTME